MTNTRVVWVTVQDSSLPSRGSFWTKMPYSPRTWASVSGEPVGPMMAGSKAETYLSRTSGVSRSGSTVTNR
jgi:hypothetical protein